MVRKTADESLIAFVWTRRRLLGGGMAVESTRVQRRVLFEVCIFRGKKKKKKKRVVVPYRGSTIVISDPTTRRVNLVARRATKHRSLG